MKKKINPNTVKTCYNCKKQLPISELEDYGVWVCKKCLKK